MYVHIRNIIEHIHNNLFHPHGELSTNALVLCNIIALMYAYTVAAFWSCKLPC